MSSTPGGADRLRDRYPDTKSYVITRGVTRLSYQDHDPEDGTPLANPRLRGWIESIVPSQIFVPQPFSRSLEALRDQVPPALLRGAAGKRATVRSNRFLGDGLHALGAGGPATHCGITRDERTALQGSRGGLIGGRLSGTTGSGFRGA